jgi:glutaminyl-peptide cyclotransferase
MAHVESRLRSLHQLKSSPNHPSKRPSSSRPHREPLFLSEAKKGVNSGFLGGAIEDDHIPFMRRGVEILHLIPSPFPRVWHTSNDDGPHLDIDTVEDWSRIVTGFTAEWMDLEGYMPVPGKPGGSLPRRSDGVLEEMEWDKDVTVQERDEL